MKKGISWIVKVAEVGVEAVVILTAVFVAGVIALVAAAMLFAAFLWLVARIGII